ncbi:MAG: PQQ-binding-like beta-propeller repeat protein, partial [Silvibacterium sp.]
SPISANPDEHWLNTQFRQISTRQKRKSPANMPRRSDFQQVPRKPVWVFQTEASRQNLPALSKPDGGPNYEAAFASNFYDDLFIGIAKLHTVGTILSSPVISGSVVYIGSADGNLYALQ